MNDPCDELSDGLTGVLLENVKLQRMPKNIRRTVANASYGKFEHRMQSASYVEYARLVKASLIRILAG